MFNLSLRAKFLILSAFVQALVVGLLIWNNMRIMDQAVSNNADRVAHEYAVTLNLSLGAYASKGRLAELQSYLNEMLSDPADSFVRYIVILDRDERPVISAGAAPAAPAALLQQAGVRTNQGVKTVLVGAMLHARAPLLLNDNQVGSLNFGLSTSDLAQARDEVLSQGSLISIAGFGIGLLLFYAFTLGIGRRLDGLNAQSQRLVQGDYGTLLPEHGGDEIEVVSRSLNTMNLALRARIAQLEQAERRLSESEARFKILFDVAPVPLSVTDHDGHIIAANLALERTFNGGAGAIVGRNAADIGFWEDAGEPHRVMALHARNGTVQGEIAKVRLADGRTGSVAIWTSSLSLDGASAIIWALLDLTEELDAKGALKELNTSLESRVRERSAALERANGDLSEALDSLQKTQHDLLAAEKMAALGSLVAGIAHELNTPIGNSLLVSTTLSDRVAEFDRLVDGGALKRSALLAHLDEVRQAAGLISGSLQKAANLIASFKQVAVDQTNDQRRRYDLLHVLQDTLATYLPRLRQAHCAARLDMPSGLTMDSYPGSLYQVVNNLINNALMHAFDGRAGGTITLRASDLGDGMIALQFSDDGNGMDEDVLRQVFDPFFTTKMGRGGTGLGMNIVYNIVTGVLGGRIHITTAPGQGTTIRIVMPSVAPLREGGKKSLPAALEHSAAI
ncbi:ATP-binding protein [Janthinobacterium fluminis]|uniref:histidine kinase n=1 Tax=Janthinobacterium fluminis TaxID=2987524 RepID=A0ABT5K5B7_9BURK|nr:ATP-binding protein [Janthinobacterium fluminis]MDC8759840.1 ATP-binding protein [Janthinobacterium fluminis]